VKRPKEEEHNECGINSVALRYHGKNKKIEKEVDNEKKRVILSVGTYIPPLF
jgi:hypothetical protein